MDLGRGDTLAWRFDPESREVRVSKGTEDKDESSKRAGKRRTKSR